MNKPQNSDQRHPEEDILNEYLDGCLSQREAAELENHLETCTECTVRLDQLRSVFTELKTIPELVLPRDLSQDILTALQPKPRFPGILKWGAVAQAALTGLILMVLLPKAIVAWGTFIAQAKDALAMVSVADWGMQVAQLLAGLTAVHQDLWQHITDWQFLSLFESAQITIWPVFLAAVLLFLFGNGLILRQVTRNGSH